MNHTEYINYRNWKTRLLLLTQFNLSNVLLYINLISDLHTPIIIITGNMTKVLTDFKHWSKFYGIPYDMEFNVHYL